MFTVSEMHMLKNSVVNLYAVCGDVVTHQTNVFIFFDGRCQPHVFWPFGRCDRVTLGSSNVFSPSSSYNWLNGSYIFDVIQRNVNGINNINFKKCEEVANNASIKVGK